MTTINLNEQPVVKKVKRSSSTITNSVSPPKQKRTSKKLSTDLTSNDQGVAVVTKKAITGPTGGILLFGVGGHNRKKKVKNDTITITTIATADDQVMTNTVISISILSPKQKRLSSMLSTHLTSTMTKTSGTKHAYTGRPPS